jgi:hypothetical protein
MEGASLLDVVDERARELLGLPLRRITREIALPSAPGAASEVVARAAMVGEATWLLLHERPIPAQRPTEEPRRTIVGRHRELAELERYLAGSESSVLYVRGPLGIGKTALLSAFATRCEQLGCPAFWIDARTSAPTEQTVVSALTDSRTSRHPLDNLLGTVQRLACRRWVLLVDNFDAWQDAAQPGEGPFVRLMSECRIIVAARSPPNRQWWEMATRSARPLTLGVLSPDDAGELQSRLGVEPLHRAEVARRAGGHPLCIVTLAAELRAPPLSVSPLVPTVLDFAEPHRREVLDAAAIPARITEDVIASMAGATVDVTCAYDFLTTICVPDPSGVGLRMPGVLRDALRARLRERSPSRLAALQARLVGHYTALLEQEKHTYAFYPIVDDFLDAFDDHPVVRRMAGGRADAVASTRRARPEEQPELLSSSQHLVAAKSKETFARRLEDPGTITVVAEGEDGLSGIIQYAVMSAAACSTTEVRADAQLEAALGILRIHAQLSPEDVVVVCLAWATTDPNGTWGPASRGLLRKLLDALLRTRAVATVFVQPESPVPLPTLAFPGATPFHVSGQIVLYRDLRGYVPGRLLGALIESDEERAPHVGGVLPRPAAIRVEDVRDALASIAQPEKLATSPLLALRVVSEEAGPRASPTERIEALARVLRETLSSLQGGSRELKEREVLEAVFLAKSGKHEKIASELAMAYSTFRRYLARGVERAAEKLRLREQLLLG